MEGRVNEEKSSYLTENKGEKNANENYMLTEREAQVLELIGHGMSQKEIAEKLCISTKTVDNHIRNIKEKYGMSKNTEMMGLYTAIKKSKKFDVKLLRQYGLEIFFALINVCTYQQ